MEHISPGQAGALRQTERCSTAARALPGVSVDSPLLLDLSVLPILPPPGHQGDQGKVGGKCKEDEPQGKVKTEL